MNMLARLTSRGRITVPKAVREALGLEPGDAVTFRVEDGEAVVKPVRSFLDLAGSLPPPPDKRGKAWEDIRRETWRARARWRR